MILISIALILISFGYCFAKFEVTKNLLVKTDIAVPVLEVEGTETTKVSAINNIGYYDFSIKNFNQENVSDVSQNYSIEIVANLDEAVKFELFQDNQPVELNNNKTKDIFIEGIEEKEHKYRLKVSYDNSKNNLQKDILEDVQIKVHSEQAKI